MNEEQRLIAIGFPIEDAITICYSLRKEGTLRKFVREQEEMYRNGVKR